MFESALTNLKAQVSTLTEEFSTLIDKKIYILPKSSTEINQALSNAHLGNFVKKRGNNTGPG